MIKVMRRFAFILATALLVILGALIASIELLPGDEYQVKQTHQPGAITPAPTPTSATATTSATFILSSERLEQGDTLVLRILSSDAETKGMRLFFGEEEIRLIKIGEAILGIKGIDVREEPGEKTIRLVVDGIIKTRRVGIISRKWPYTELALSKEQKKQGYTPEKVKQELAASDNAKLYKALDAPLPEVYFDGPFIYPLSKEAEIVGAFGNIRKSGATEIRHLGVDLEADLGAPVFASQNGVVRLARNLSNFGNTIVIDHGYSIFSLYLHLDRIDVEEGMQASKGEQIGAVGNTGLYTLEPHLHFSIKATGASVDPLKFLEAAGKFLRN